VKIEHSYQGNEQYCTRCNAPRKAHRGARTREYKAKPCSFFGIDGEGQTDRIGQTNGVGGYPGKHRYVMLCAADETGREYVVENPKGLRTTQCLDFMLSLPKRDSKFFAYSFGYDLTKILEDIDDNILFRLIRPELRRVVRGGRKVLAPVYWPSKQPKYALNWMNGRFSVKKLEGTMIVPDPKTGGPTTKYKWGQAIVIHDVWKFFQGKFTAALEDWKVPDKVTKGERKVILDRMREMKDKRANFDQLTRGEIRAYCFEECRYMATLSRKLTEAHEKAKIPLKNYFGAGSSAEAMLLVMNVKEHVEKARKENPPEYDVEYAMRCAFFGGRFENGRIGAVSGKVYGKDISSAYPYQLVTLPCLIHGRWERTTDRKAIERARTAIVRYTLEEPTVKRAWAPFPFRLKNGSIAFPETSGGGWVWRDEYLAGEKLFDNVRFQEAWLYHCDCGCQPFKDIPKYYAARVLIGKEGPGIVIKLGTNSCYGKTAQTVGGEPGTFHSWMWAGLITSGCRAQVLEAMAAHSDLDNMLMVATDGIATLEQIVLPGPHSTGTNWLPCPEPDPKDVAESPEVYRKEGNQWLVNKPLGGWEEKILQNGLFLARPGIYFPLEPTEADIKRIRARGLGRAAVWDNWAKIVEAYEKGYCIETKKKERIAGIRIQDLSLFRGIKTSITRSGTPGSFSYRRSDQYGRWISRPVDMTFNPMPKREREVGEGGRLRLRRIEGESAVYNKGILSPEALILLQQTIEESEQPDGGDLTDANAWDE
jgi:DNA polymerase type B, organellar and viral